MKMSRGYLAIRKTAIIYTSIASSIDISRAFEALVSSVESRSSMIRSIASNNLYSLNIRLEILIDLAVTESVILRVFVILLANF
jgi:hypothetical protein